MDGANKPAIAGTFIADSTIYVDNHGSDNVTLHNLSRLMDQAVNQEITLGCPATTHSAAAMVAWRRTP